MSTYAPVHIYNNYSTSTWLMGLTAISDNSASSDKGTARFEVGFGVHGEHFILEITLQSQALVAGNIPKSKLGKNNIFY